MSNLCGLAPVFATYMGNINLDIDRSTAEYLLSFVLLLIISHFFIHNTHTV